MTTTSKVIALSTLLLTACTGNPDFEGIVGKGDSPNTVEAHIKGTATEPTLTIKYRDGVVWPNLTVPVSISYKLNSYEVVRSDTKEKYTLSPAEQGHNLYVCTECVTSSDKGIPLMWVRK
jgi:hypothetical protein